MDNPEQLDQIAVIGLACRFPGARNVDEFWHNLSHGVESVTFFTDEELRAAGVDETRLSDPNYVKARPVVEGIGEFDAPFFQMNPKEASMLDPQHRVFLECSWEALEAAGYDSEQYKGRIGVFAGSDTNTYLLNCVLPSIDLLSSVSVIQSKMNDKDYLSTRVSYKLNLKGPSVTVQTACSTSLVAIHQACESLLNGQCDLSLAGGVSFGVPQIGGYTYETGGIVSPDGHCRAFDASSQGTIFGDGIGVVILKRLEDAIADGDCIHAVVLGSAINNDGSDKVGFTAPSISGQAEVIAEALTVANTHPETITYVEAHGTATAMGDPIEIMALTRAFGSKTQKTSYCAIGTVKTNVGHLSTAAGMAGFIKTVLCLKHRQLPPTLHYREANPQIDFAGTPFYVNHSLQEWEIGSGFRRAGVSSFGMGGTNAHLILQEAPRTVPSAQGKAWHSIMLSARSLSALENYKMKLAAFLQENKEANIADLAYTLQVGRRSFAYRTALACRSAEEALSLLGNDQTGRMAVGIAEGNTPSVTFLFPGLGEHYPGMAAELYRTEPVFRKHLDRCLELVEKDIGYDLRGILLSEDSRDMKGPGLDLRRLMQGVSGHPEDPPSVLHRPLLSYPAIFSVEYALASTLAEWGIRPRALIGHSIGEYAAACIAGVFTLEDALKLICRRGEMMESLPPGAMLAVMAPPEVLIDELQNGLSVSVLNGPASCVVAGKQELITELSTMLLNKGIACRRVSAGYAFHSPMVEPILERFEALIQTVSLQPPSIPYISNLTGTWITREQAVDPGYWVQHLRQPVRLSEGIEELWRDRSRVFLEVGPGQMLTTLFIQHPASGGAFESVISTMAAPHDGQPAAGLLTHALGRLWTQGVPLDWAKYYQGERRQRLTLPTYPFEKKTYWIHPGPADIPMVGSIREPSGMRWYSPGWRRALQCSHSFAVSQKWLLFADQQGLGAGLAERLVKQGQEVVLVTRGESFIRHSRLTYSLDSRCTGHYEELVRELVQYDLLPDKVLDCRSLGAEGEGGAQDGQVPELLAWIQCLERIRENYPVDYLVLSEELQEVTGSENLSPVNRNIMSLLDSIPLEYPHLTCRIVDLEAGITDTREIQRWTDVLWHELAPQADSRLSAYRNRLKWVPDYYEVQPIPEQMTEVLPEGIYVVIGADSEIGGAVAEYLAKDIPTASDGVLPVQDPPAATEKVRFRLKVIIRSAGEIHSVRHEIGSPEECGRLLETVRRTWGQIRILFCTEEAILPVTLQPVSSVTEVSEELQWLADLVLENEPEQVIVCTSLLSALGGFGACHERETQNLLHRWVRNSSSTGGIHWRIVQLDRLPENARQTPSLMTDHGQRVSEAESAARLLVLGLDHILADHLIISQDDLNARLAGDRRVILDSEESMPAALHERPLLRMNYLAPRNETEQKIAELWQNALGIRNVGVEDNFFELGGNSLLAVQLIFQIRQSFNIEIALADLVKEPTVAFLSAYIDTFRWAESENSEPDITLSSVQYEEIEL